jgi:hypothetical protein
MNITYFNHTTSHVIGKQSKQNLGSKLFSLFLAAFKYYKNIEYIILYLFIIKVKIIIILNAILYHSRIILYNEINLYTVATYAVGKN